MKKNIYTLRIKDLDNIVQDEIDYAKIMREVLGYKNYAFMRKYTFARAFKKAHHLVEISKKIDIREVEEFESCRIKRPQNIDHISFRAMMELQAIVASPGERTVTDLIIDMVTISCFSSNISKPYSSETKDYRDFRNYVSESPLSHILGLYNWVDKSMKESEKMWEKRFMSVHVLDQDYEDAGGARMSQFNVISTIEATCSSFNCTMEEAWQVSYNITQTMSYMRATRSRIQDDMRQIKEARMEAKRKSNQPT